MANQNYSKYKILFIILAVIIVILEIPGALDLKNEAYTGFYDDGNNTITKVFDNSPAKKAGLKKGDYIISVDGVSTSDTETWLRKPRTKIGETHTYIVKRDEQELNLDLTYSGLPTREVISQILIGVIGLCFLIFGLIPYLKTQTKNTTLLALVGIFLGFTLCHQPYIASYTFRMLYFMFINLLAAFGFAFILHFMLSFPKVKNILQKKHTLKFLYVPAVILSLFIIWILIAQPEATSGLNRSFNILTGLFIFCYFGLALIAMTHSFVKATKEERKASGLNFLLIGTIIGFAPFIIFSLLQIIAPKVVLPGSDYYFIAFILIPISLAVATWKKETV